MAIGPTLLAATALSALSGLLLVALVTVWYRNYRTFGSRMTLGLVAFGVTLLVENVVAVYFFFSSSMLYAMSDAAQMAVLVMRLLQVIALAFLTYVSMD